MKQWKWVVPVLAVNVLACGGNGAPAEASGNLSLALVGTASDGTQYRLRDGVFDISGYPTIYDQGGAQAGAAVGGMGPSPGYFFDTVTTEADPDASAITMRLIPGWYTVNLYSGWRIEQLSPSGPIPVEQSVLLTSPNQSAYVYNGGTSDVVYRFGIGGEIVDFRSGELNIRVEYELPGDEPSYGGYAGYGGYGGYPVTPGPPATPGTPGSAGFTSGGAPN